MFSFSDPNTKCNITVGYISSERGLVEGVGLYEANKYAKLNPGTQFIFRNRDFVKYLNINEVNKLQPQEMLPSNRSGAGSCSGIVGLNLQGDTTKSVDDAFDFEEPLTGGSTRDGARDGNDKTTVNFYGGGGVGVQAAPIICNDGSIMAVQVIHGGYGYKYPPIVDIEDPKGKGAGVVAKAFVKTRTSDEKVLIQEYDAEEDYEEYVLDKCVPGLENIGYGFRWNADGKNLGKWDPMVYFNNQKDPIKYEILRYQKYLADLKDGTIVENGRIKGWWTTRQKVPSRITSPDKVSREKFDVEHHAWGGRVTPSSNNSSNNNSSSSTGTDFVEATFLVYTEGGGGKISGVVGTDLKFVFTAIDDPTSSQAHSFQIKAESFVNREKAEEIKIKVKRNTKYNVVSSGNYKGKVVGVKGGKGLTEQGLLESKTFGKRGGTEKDKGIGDTIFTDLIGSANDNDDLQIQAKTGIFTSGTKNLAMGYKGDSWALTYEYKDSDAFKGGSDKGTTGGKGSGQKTEIFKTFMNQYAISPIPPSNVAGSDKAGINYTFEWEEEIPWDGD